jgi:hypothetical protein
MARGFLHRLFGGATDAGGAPVHEPDGLVEVIDVVGPDVDVVHEALDDVGIEHHDRVYVPLGAAWGAATDPRIVISVRAHALDAANALLDQVPTLGIRSMPSD